MSFLSSLSSIDIPKDWKQVVNDPNWKSAMVEEMKALTKKGLRSSLHFLIGRKLWGVNGSIRLSTNLIGALKDLKLEGLPRVLLKPLELIVMNQLFQR